MGFVCKRLKGEVVGEDGRYSKVPYSASIMYLDIHQNQAKAP